ncbi:hypothetical protein K504DRAFT_468250 [Pleomassaria siparia CBS 279.74]|uniref:EthD domain-containing protein n=1 Tax=Pleomassaria siparia CBS 279.74 TaxID=1314801 RepID=A0A6G1K990_9PLEO|nr:hypothetical protein K504DRAFT_468250 [Pleomassaria siparia CBS 279.74]
MTSKIAVVVSYPSQHPTTKAPLTFDMKYYLATHMPLIEGLWGPHGLKRWSINTFPDPCPLTGQTPPYRVQTTCWFDSVEQLKNAMEKGGDKGRLDIENFSNVQPIICVGEKGEAGMMDKE